MAILIRSLSVVLAAAMLAACSSPGVGPTPQVPAFASSAHHGGKGRLVLRIRVPRKKKTGRHVAPRYISPATAGLTVAITGPTDVSKIVALTPNATGCSSSLAGTFCTLTIPGLSACPSSANCYTATIATYDAISGCPSACAIPGTAHKLSSNQNVAFTVKLGEANQINATLDGVPTSVVLVPDADATLSGNMASGFALAKCNSPAQHVGVIGLDADSNYILGAGAPTPSLASNDGTNLPVTATPSPSSPNRFTLTPPVLATSNKVVQLTIGVTPLAGSGTSAVTTHVNVNFGGGICQLYVADTGNGVVQDIVAVDGTIPASPTINAFGSGVFNEPTGVAVDAAGNVYVADQMNGAAKEILAVNGVIPASPTIKTLATGFSNPKSVAVDSSGNVYVADFGNSAVKEIVAVGGTIPASPTVNTLGSSFSLPEGVAVDASGNVFVADSGHGEVKEMIAVGGSIPASPTINTLGSGFSSPEGVAVDASGNVYVADEGHNAVKEMLAVSGSIPASPTIATLGSGFSAPTGVAVDGAGDVYVADNGNSLVKEILAVGGSIPASPTINTLGSGFSEPTGVAVR
jgi:DNA-binding beta-propeller fold protein YncE